MNNPIAKVCRIIESCETEEQLAVARRVGQRAIKQYPGCTPLIYGTLQYAEGLFMGRRIEKEYESMQITTEHVGYDRHNVIIDGDTVGRAYPTENHGKWAAQGYLNGVTVTIHCRASMEQAAEHLAAALTGVPKI